VKISVMAPVKNEADFIGFSIMAVLPHVHEFVYACAQSNDGTDEMLDYIKTTYAKDKLIVSREPQWDFNVHDMAAYNASFNFCIETATGDAVWFLHPDMIVLNPEKIADIGGDALAFYCTVNSYAKDGHTLITKGRTNKWKNIHRKTLGLHYFGGYGSQNEDFYHSDITSDEHDHYGDNFSQYPFDVADSGIRLNHYCECKPYSRRYGKMVACLETLYPNTSAERIEELAANHPRVNLESRSNGFGDFQFADVSDPLPNVFDKYGAEFERILGRTLIK
jgi:hypothetical protein